LNNLIDATMDSARHYRKVASDVSNPSIRAWFERRATERKMIAQSLRDQLQAISGNPQADAAAVSSVHRVFGNLRYAMGYGYTALVDEVERGEERVKAKYEHALQDGGLSGLSRTVVQNAYESVCAGCAEMRALKRYPNVQHDRGERLGQW
jgi:uncharacterized protein (TIGR02284 family)